MINFSLKLFLATFLGVVSYSFGLTAQCIISPTGFADCDTNQIAFEFDQNSLKFDKTIPAGVSSVILEAKGGNGGSVSGACTGIPAVRYGGGGGYLKVEFPVHQDSAHWLQPGGILRIVPGEKGDLMSPVACVEAGGGGGGASGISYLCPDCDPTSDWIPVIVAGGGGGAYAQTIPSIDGDPGRGGRLSTTSGNDGNIGFSIQQNGVVYATAGGALQPELDPPGVPGGSAMVTNVSGPCKEGEATCFGDAAVPNGGGFLYARGGYGWAGGGHGSASVVGPEALGYPGGGGGYTGGNAGGADGLDAGSGGYNWYSSCLEGAVILEEAGGDGIDAGDGWIRLEFNDGPPFLECFDLTVELNESGEVEFDDEIFDIAVSDFCDIDEAYFEISPDCSDIGRTIVNPLIAIDSRGDTASCEMNMTIAAFPDSARAYALSFYNPSWEGVLDHKEFVRAEIGEVTLGASTVESWFKLDDFTLTEVDLFQQGSIFADEGFTIRLSYNRITFVNHATSVSASADYDFELDTWYHFAVVTDGTEVRLYVNGSLISSGFTGSFTNSSDSLFIGGDESTPDIFMFDGLLDDIRVWNSARSEGQIGAFMDEEVLAWYDDLLAYFPLNDGRFGAGSNRHLVDSIENMSGGAYAQMIGFDFNGCNWSIDHAGLKRTAGVRIDPNSDLPSEATESPGVFTMRISSPDYDETNVVSTISGTATNTQDYTGLSNTTTFPPGVIETTFQFSTLNDTLVEYPEMVTIEPVPGVRYGTTDHPSDYRATHTIINDDIAVLSLTAIDDEAVEFTLNTGEFQFTLDRPIPFGIEIPFIITGSATNGEDFVTPMVEPIPASVNFASNTTTATVEILPFGDEMVEPTEYVVLTIDQDGVSLPVVNDSDLMFTTDTVTILNVDTATIKLTGDLSPVQEDEGVMQTMTLELDKPSQHPMTVDLIIQGDVDIFADFDGIIASQVNIPAEETSVDIQWMAEPDLLVEGNEVAEFHLIAVSAQGPVYISSEFDSIPRTIIDNDSSQVNIVGSVDTIDEASGVAWFDVTMTNPSSEVTSIFYSVTGSASNGGDYTFISNSIDLPAGTISDNIVISGVDDILVEGYEDVVVKVQSIYGVENRIIPGNQKSDTIVIKDDDACLPSGTNTIYVAQSGDDSDGLTWATAFHDPQDAIDLALSCGSGSLAPQIWIKEGVYIPTKDTAGNAAPLDDRTKTFYITGEIAMYGGFKGTEMAIHQRDTSNRTVFSGNVDGVPGNAGDASHIMFIDGTESSISNFGLVDGIHFEDANVDDNFGAGGIIVYHASPVIRSCSFTQLNGFEGGAIYFEGQDVSGPARIERCLFVSNTGLVGGAVCTEGSESETSPRIFNSMFKTNTANAGGAGYHVAQFGGISETYYANCAFINNNGGDFGGAIFNQGDFGTCASSLTNCSFVGNHAGQGAAVYNNNLGGNGESSFINSIFWGNTDGNMDEQVKNFEAYPSFQNCIVQGSGGSDNWTPGGNGYPDDPGLGIDHGGNLDVSPMFADSAAGDLTLINGSPAIDVGVELGEILQIDLGGNLRIVGSTIDIGAYEFGRNTYIPDNAFEQYLIDNGIDSDGVLNDSVPTSDISSLLFLDVDGQGIADMTGIQDFQALEQLNCGNNSFDSLNLSLNNSVYSVNLENSTSLTYLNLTNSQVTTINMPDVPAIQRLECAGTPLLGIDISSNMALSYLDLSDCSVLEFADLSNGANAILSAVDLRESLLLACIKVDNPLAASSGSGSYAGWQFSPTLSFAGGQNTWTGGIGNWNDGSKWSMNREPSLCENVIIDAPQPDDAISVDPGTIIDILNMTVINGEVLLGNGASLHLHAEY